MSDNCCGKQTSKCTTSKCTTFIIWQSLYQNYEIIINDQPVYNIRLHNKIGCIRRHLRSDRSHFKLYIVLCKLDFDADPLSGRE